MDSEYEVETDGSTTWTLSGFKNEQGVDEMKEVKFIQYYFITYWEINRWNWR